MKTEKAIIKRISKYKAMISKFRRDKTLSKSEKRCAIFTLQQSIRDLKWIFKS